MMTSMRRITTKMTKLNPSTGLNSKTKAKTGKKVNQLTKLRKKIKIKMLL